MTSKGEINFNRRALTWNHNTMFEHLVGLGIKEAVVEHSLDGDTWNLSPAKRRELPALEHAEIAKNMSEASH